VIIGAAIIEKAAASKSGEEESIGYHRRNRGEEAKTIERKEKAEEKTRRNTATCVSKRRRRLAVARQRRHENCENGALALGGAALRQRRKNAGVSGIMAYRRRNETRKSAIRGEIGRSIWRRNRASIKISIEEKRKSAL